MGKETGIAWTDHTFNIAWGCFKVSPGCKHCYAETFSKRTGHDIWGPPETTSRRTFGAKHWTEPLAWNAAAKREGVRKRVFCSSMCDVFEDHPTIATEREKLWPLIRATPQLDWQLLTKRPERIAANLPDDWGTGYPNVWLGTSIESREYGLRIPQLLRAPAALHFLSVEPMLAAVRVEPEHLSAKPHSDWCGPGFECDDICPTVCGHAGRKISWVIVGGESGPGHREMPLDDALALIDAVKASGSSVFVKQDSGPKPGRQGRIPDAYWIQEMPD